MTKLILAAIALILPFTALASTGSVDPANKYAWGSNVGWVNFSPTNGNVAVSGSYLSGDVWSENYGWINLSPNASGVKNDGTGILSGYAWGENTGYLNFSGVQINAQGVFTGTATGDIVGSLTFDCKNCKVTTTWRPSTGVSATNPTQPPVSVASGGTILPPTFTLNNGASATPSPTVTLSFSTSPSVKSFSLTNENALGSATATSSYQSALSWNLCAGLTACSPGAYSVTVRFLDSNNNTLGTVSHSIAYVPAGSSTPVPTTTSASSVVSPSTDPAEQLAALQAELQTLLNQVSTSTSATSATVATPSSQFTRDLKLGLTGSDVKQLQAYLISQNAGTAARALKAHGTTKNFASLTKAALIEFQKKVGIAPAQGYFGPVTRAYVNSHIR